MKLLFTTLLTVVCLTGAGCSDITTNTHCPIMGNEVDPGSAPSDMVVMWNGKKVIFCCPPCLEEWDELSEAEKEEHFRNPPKSSGHGH